MDVDLVELDDVMELVTEVPPSAANCCVSLVMPSHPTGNQQRQDPIRLDNLVKKAQEKLVERGVGRPDARRLTEPATALINDFTFWQHQGRGLVLYLAEDFHRVVRLADQADEQVIVGPRFFIKPLLSSNQVATTFYILALTHETARLYRCDQNAMHEIEDAAFPLALEAVAGTRDAEEHLQNRSFQSPSMGPGTPTRGGRGRNEAIYHGGGEGEGKLQADEAHFHQEVAQRLEQRFMLRTVPIVLAADDRVAGNYRKYHRGSNLLPQAVDGSPDERKPDELRRLAWELVVAAARTSRSELDDRYGNAASAGRAAAGLQDCIPAAAVGRVDTLLLDAQALRWGRFSHESGEVELFDTETPHSEELTNLAAVETLRNTGRVEPLPADALPSEEPVAAILRY